MQAVYRFQPLDAGVAEQVSHLFILFQQTHQILLVLWLFLLLDSRRRSIVRPNGGYQQLRIFIDIGHRRVLFIGSQQLRQVQLSSRRIQCVHVDGRCEQQRRSDCFWVVFGLGVSFLRIRQGPSVMSSIHLVRTRDSSDGPQRPLTRNISVSLSLWPS